MQAILGILVDPAFQRQWQGLLDGGLHPRQEYPLQPLLEAQRIQAKRDATIQGLFRRFLLVPLAVDPETGFYFEQDICDTVGYIMH